MAQAPASPTAPMTSTAHRLPSRPFPPGFKLALMIALYEVAWHLALPFVLLFLWRRGKKEPLYRAHWNERFGAVTTALWHPLWIHSASMGELRGAAPLVRALLHAGYPVIVTTLTPAGRTAGHQAFLGIRTFGGSGSRAGHFNGPFGPVNGSVAKGLNDALGVSGGGCGNHRYRNDTYRYC